MLRAKDVNVVVVSAAPILKKQEPPKNASAARRGDGLESLEGRAFVRAREAQAAELMRQYEARLGVPVGVQVTWSKRLNKTAGQTRLLRRGPERAAAVELATKVVDTTAKLRCTLAHEVCHAAAWVMDEVARPPHGEAFRRWARRFEQEMGVEISTCHSYEIAFKFNWECTGCGQTVGRHSKSFDPAKYRCGSCQGQFVQIA